MHRLALALIVIAGLLSAAACATAPGASPAAQPAPGSFTREALLEDFDRAANVLLTRNPLKFADRDEVSRVAAAQRAALRDGMSELDFYRVLTPLIVGTRCGHTGIFLSRAAEAGMEAGQRYLPILVRIVDGRPYVLSPLAGRDPPAGSEVTAINGRAAAEIIDTMMQNITADGANLTRKLYVAGRVFNDLFTLFVDPSPVFRIEYRDPRDGSTRISHLAGVLKADLERQAADAGYPYGLPEDRPAWEFSEVGGTPVLAVRSFYFPAGSAVYERFIDRVFDTLRKRGARTLVLDVRGNWGGAPEASSYLFARLEKEAVPYFAKGTPFYAALTHPLPPAENAFTGRLLVLTDGACFSSTGHLCSLLRFHGLATFVGEETGGSWTCTDASQDYTLSRTGMRLHSSLQAFRTAVTGMPLGRGILPDVEVEPTMADLMTGRDPVLERALELAGAGVD